MAFQIPSVPPTTNKNIRFPNTLIAQVEELIAKRQEARKNKDFKTADAIRDQLADMGIVLKDTPQGVQWSRK